MSFYGYTQLINVNDWKIDEEVANLITISPSSTNIDFIYKINYNLNDGYQKNYDTDKDAAAGDAFKTYIGATWKENQGYDGTIWQVRIKKDENGKIIYYLVKLANTNSVIPQISVDYYSPEYGEKNNLPLFDEEHSNPAGFILQASPNWKIKGENIGKNSQLKGPTSVFYKRTDDDEILLTKDVFEATNSSSLKNYKDGFSYDTKIFNFNFTQLNDALGLLYNIIYGTDNETREQLLQDTSYFTEGQPGLLSLLKSNNNEISYQTITLGASPDIIFNSETENYNWNISTDINSNSATSVELLINETDDINTNQAVYCNFEIIKWEENLLVISGTSKPTDDIKLILKYTH